jgi:PAS domain S-box-containing protein
MQKRLQKIGYSVDLEVDGMSGLARALTGEYDFAIIDQMLPGLNGLDLLTRLVESGIQTPTVMLTASGDERIAVQAMKLGARDYLLKDDHGDYLELIEAVIERGLEYRSLLQERQHIETALLENEEKFIQLVEHIQQVFWIRDPGLTRLFYISPIYEKIWGRNVEDVYANPAYLTHSVHPEDRLMVEEHVQIQHLHDDDLEYRIVRPDNETRWIRTRTFPMRNRAGLVDRVAGISEDITERKEAEAALRHSEERYRLLATYSTDMISRRTPEGVFLYVSPASARLLGYTPEELVGKSIYDLLPPPQVDLTRQIHVHLITQPDVQTLAYELRRKEGQYVWIEATARNIYDSVTGQVSEILETSRDIGERKRAEDEIIRRNRQLLALHAAGMEVSSTLDLDMILKTATQEMAALLDVEGVIICPLPKNDAFITEAVAYLPDDWTTHRWKGYLSQLTGSAYYTQVVDEQQKINLIISDDNAPEEIAALMRKEGLKTWIMLPLVVKGEAIGSIILIDSRQERMLTDDEFSAAELLGVHTAAAIENAQLFKRAQEAATIEERQRLARDLHDSVSQTLFSASMIAQSLPMIFGRDQARGLAMLDELGTYTRSALAEMRTLLLELRPDALIQKEPGELIQSLASAFTGRTMVPVDVDVTGTDKLPPDVQIALYRIAQEALNNATKHARASHVAITLQYRSDSTQMMVQDDGRGFDLSAIKPENMGVRIMRERAESIGGILDVSSQPGKGTRVEFHWEES